MMKRQLIKSACNMGYAEIQLSTALGYPIVARAFLPQSTFSQVVVITSATGVKQNYYEAFAEHLQALGIAVYTFDYGGIGASKLSPLKTFTTSARQWGKVDLEAMIQYAKKQYPDQKIALLGHSIGGQISGLAPSTTLVDKIVLVASQSGYWRFWSGWGRWQMFFYWYFLFPLLCRLFGYLPAKRISSMEDLPKGMALEWSKWCSSKNYLFDHVPEEDCYYHLIDCPIEIYSVSDDAFAPKAAVDWLAEKFTKTKVLRHHLIPKDLGVPKIGHFGFFKKRFADLLWSRISDSIRI